MVKRLDSPDDWQRVLATLGAVSVVGLVALLLRPELRHRLGEWLLRSAAPAAVSRARVLHVIDGDTLVIEGGSTVRLLGIDAPETSNPALAHEQPYGREATLRLQALVEDQKVLLERDISETDRYGRLLRHVWLDGRLVSEILVAEGVARVYRIPPDRRYAERLAKAEERARKAGVGLWSLPQPTPIGVFQLLPAPGRP